MTGAAASTDEQGAPSDELSRLRRSLRRAHSLAWVAIALGALGLLSAFAAGVAVLGLATARDPSDLVAEAEAGTMLIHSRGPKGGDGSGWVIDADEGLVVTNFHVLTGGTRFDVDKREGTTSARLVAAAPCEDLALLRVDDPRGLVELPLGDQSDLLVGEPVIALGFPVTSGILDDVRLSASSGVVSVAETPFESPSIDSPRFPNMVKTDAALDAGNSGGPLLDDGGEVVGTNTYTLPDERRAELPSGQGQNYAVGADRTREVLGDLRAGRSRGFFGAGFEFPSARRIRRDRLPPGPAIGTPMPGSAAGLRTVEGAVIRRVDGRPVSENMTSYCDAVRGVRSGQRALVDIVRPGGRRQQVQLTFE